MESSLTDFTKTGELYHSDVYAVRKFRLNESFKLYGYTMPQEFISQKTNVASCAIGRPHKAPDEDCTCGFYAYDSKKIWWHESNNEKNLVMPGSVKAVVRLSGKIVVCERGLRSEHLEIIALAVNPYEYF